MTNIETREHLSTVLDEVPADAVLIDFDENHRQINTEHALFWLAHKHTPEPTEPISRTRAMGIIAAKEYDADLTYSVALKEELEAIETELQSEAGNVFAAVTVRKDPDGEQQYEFAFCSAGIVPEQLVYTNEPSRIRIATPGSVNFHLSYASGDTIHLSGESGAGTLPIHIDTGRYDDVSMLSTLVLGNEVARKLNTTHLLKENAIGDKLTELYSPVMAAELALQIAVALDEQSPEKASTLYAGNEVILEHLQRVKHLADDHVAFYQDVYQKNQGLFAANARIGEIPMHYAGLREKFSAAYSALYEKYEDVIHESITAHQIRYELTRTWPYYDFDVDSTRLANQGLPFATVQREVERENAEMTSRIQRAQGNLKVLNKILN